MFNADFILQEKRYSWIDYDKGISILLVGYGHCLLVLAGLGIDFSHWPWFTYIGMFLYGFRMPLFFIISGVFLSGSLGRKGFGGYIYGRSNNILYPLLIWGGLEVTFQLLSAYHKFHTFDAGLYLDMFTHPRRIGTGHLWYLNALYTIGVLYVCLKQWLKMGPVAQLILGLALYVVSAYLHVNDIEAGMLTDLCAFYIWYALGVSIAKVVLDEKKRKGVCFPQILFPFACGLYRDPVILYAAEPGSRAGAPRLCGAQKAVFVFGGSLNRLHTFGQHFLPASETPDPAFSPGDRLSLPFYLLYSDPDDAGNGRRDDPRIKGDECSRSGAGRLGGRYIAPYVAV